MGARRLFVAKPSLIFVLLLLVPCRARANDLCRRGLTVRKRFAALIETLAGQDVVEHNSDQPTV